MSDTAIQQAKKLCAQCGAIADATGHGPKLTPICKACERKEWGRLTNEMQRFYADRASGKR